MGRRAYDKLAKICASLNTSEQELAYALGISRIALKSIERPDAPLYLRLALAALLSDMDPDEVLNATHSSPTIDVPLHILSTR
ncbi:hypothetical protein WKW50_09415 [Ochrobactrum sp. GPK 3]|jgi:DNA-binding XRE family transcriptional regulator|uniref:hypothetical protein n=1 Tax=Brucella/Ochrobactrum group TaxID=2826938 RepID=UPI000994673A|nr:hypothetical protein [Brucella haematophila]KAB2697844.1 hypothetical protein F9K79_15345 [Ochrobactrum sp. Kaboul]MBA8818655.1 DNA-binding XRE family transcriptional regulator [Ochrobactrum sp. P6BSIII]OOL17210.1 hypothetical protein BRY73_11140 [Ochrobactrum sp. P6BS-III]TMV03165.1 hypothetical protein FGI60_12185 [Brucella haematophila]